MATRKKGGALGKNVASPKKVLKKKTGTLKKTGTRKPKKINLSQELKKIFLVHGESPAQKHLREHLLATGVKEVEIVEYDKRYQLFLAQ